MRYIKLLVASVILMSMSACITDNQSDLEMLGYIKTINIVGPDEITFEQMGGAEQTKATSVNNGSALVFNWAVGDTLGIFPNKGNQVEFPITAQEGSTSASFDGGGWALRNNASYAAYYPFSVWNYFRNNKTVVMDYSGQVQNGNGSFDHLSAYDFLASAKTTPRNSTVTFQMDRQGSILYIDMVVPEPATITSLTISCNEAIFVEKAALDISGNTPVVTPIETKESLTLSFVNTTTTETNETVRAYMAVQPLDFSSKTVIATLITDAGTYTAPVVSRVVNKGKAAFLRFSDSFTESVSQPNNEIWYTSTDGNIVVPNNTNLFGATLLSNTYKNGKGVMSFDGPVTMVGDKSYLDSGTAPFDQCGKLLSISLPESVEMIGYAAFNRCKSLQTVNMPSHLTFMAIAVFESTAISSINVPETDEFWEGNVIGPSCSNLAEITGPYASEDGRCLIVDDKLYAFAPAGLESYAIEEGITEICHLAFSGCKELRTVSLPSTLKVIWGQSFCVCPFETLVFPEGLERIDFAAYSGCSSLISVTLPSTLSHLGSWVFNNCTSIQSFSGKYASADGRLLIDNGSIKAFAQSGLTEYTIPEGITNATDGFVGGGLLSLESMTLPSTLLSLALRGPSLTTLTSLATTPPSVPSTASNNLDLPKVEVIYVPAGSVDAYKSANYWSTYADRIQAIPDNTIPEAVDLGLPSGLKWASFNLGASAPEEYGDYFAWGDTEPNYLSMDPISWRDGKTGYNWMSYKFRTSGDSRDNVQLSKYNTDNLYGIVDNRIVLELEEDAAHVGLGGSWRIPTDAEWDELSGCCSWTWTTQNEVNGYLVTGSNDNSIFLPAAGRREGTYLSNEGSYGFYWSSLQYGDYPGFALDKFIWSDGRRLIGSHRCYGHSIRPVSDEDSRVSVTGISLNKSSLDLAVGESESLTATVTPSNATQPNVIWSSSNTSVATVDYTGKVTAVAEGSATIMATTFDRVFTSNCIVTVTANYSATTGLEKGHEWVDLGLTSGLKWASCNIGASIPEGYGDFYAWGETEPYYSSLDPLIWKTGKSYGYDWASYKWCNGTAYSITKYGTVDNKSILELEDDAAHVNWGGRWRMPTYAEWTELISDCSWTWTTQNEVYGILVTGPNGNSIFLPRAGYRGLTNYYEVYGIYWSSFRLSNDPDYQHKAYRVIFGSGSFYGNAVDRASGNSVRAVIQ